MGRPSHSPIWPFLIVVAFLFLLSIIAPREWEQLGRRKPVASSTTLSEAVPANYAHVPAVVPSEVEPGDTEGQPTMAAVDAPQPGTERADHHCDVGAAEAQPPVAEEQVVDAANTDRAPSASVAAQSLSPESCGPADHVDEQPVEKIENVLRAESQPAKEAASVEPEATAEIETAAEPQSSSIKPAPAVVQQDDPAPTGLKWATPADLQRRLDLLACECQCTDWAIQVGQLVDELCGRTSPSDARAQEILARLRAHAGEVDALVPEIGERTTVIELLRVRHALVRRLDVWEMIPRMVGEESELAPDRRAIDRLAAAVDELEKITGQAGAEGAQWQRYLALDEVRKITRSGAMPPSDAQQLAREIVSRLERTDLSAGQQKFITSRPVVALVGALRPWTLPTLDAAQLLSDLERFETTTQASDARRLADDYLQTTWLTSAAGGLAERLEANYRNANIRLVLTEKLLNRVMPGLSTSTDPVRDQILGIPTRGVSTTSTKVGVKLVPDKERLRVALEANGQVLANTQSTSGPATLRTHSDSFYYARKVVSLDLHGIRTEPAEAECLGTSTRLRGVETTFDGVPLVGALMENVVRSRHAEKEDEVRSELRRRVEMQARRKMDSETEMRLEKVNRALEERIVRPLERLALDPQVISAETTDQRLTMRVRLAGQEQLAGHTPRPRAQSDSLFSLQLHQSVFNNICEQLKLNGRTFRLPELRQHIITALNLENSPFMNDTDRDVSITFADQDAVRVRCEDGRMELTMAVARLTHEDTTWKNFQVRVFYRPEVEGLQARLVRDGIVQLVGGRQLRSQIALRGIFSKVFAKERDLVLIDPKWSTDERTRDLAFSQFSIQDGWIAVAVAEPPQNLAKRKDGQKR